jgi:hypothetical protein
VVIGGSTRSEGTYLTKLAQNDTAQERVLEPGQPLGHAFAMDRLPPPLAFFCLLFSGWVNRQQQAVI